jgi:hypothetical protein
MSRPFGWKGTLREQYATDFDALIATGESIASAVRTLSADPKFAELTPVPGHDDPQFLKRLETRYRDSVGVSQGIPLGRSAADLRVAHLQAGRNPDFAPLILGGVV